MRILVQGEEHKGWLWPATRVQGRSIPLALPGGYLQPTLLLAKPQRRALANQVVASIISLMHSLANLIRNKKMVDGRGGKEGDQHKIRSINTLLSETEGKTIGQLCPSVAVFV